MSRLVFIAAVRAARELGALISVEGAPPQLWVPCGCQQHHTRDSPPPGPAPWHQPGVGNSIGATAEDGKVGICLGSGIHGAASRSKFIPEQPHEDRNGPSIIPRNCYAFFFNFYFSPKITTRRSLNFAEF